MWKKCITYPRLLVGLTLLLFLLLTGWQWLQVTQLGRHWQQFPQRTLATPLADYAELHAVRALLTDNAAQHQQLVDELASIPLIDSAVLYNESAHLLASSAPQAANKEPSTVLPYIRSLYYEETPVGFLHLQLANNPIAVTQHNIWQQLTQHINWLLSLCLLLGLFVGLLLGLLVRKISHRLPRTSTRKSTQP
ncbi:hypothetical protein [Oceanisphaera pacifica]|uniref:Smp protein n=1 Tax=Oceanisphaera pacifica TaxID=2818389 RepID=A0ABS3NCY8_9GAMM|nr:hypothetical protein [Oceanisphaera pacifica]MBO1518337.1 hypothetical protein [Oceanisphaera pacifica]